MGDKEINPNLKLPPVKPDQQLPPPQKVQGNKNLNKSLALAKGQMFEMPLVYERLSVYDLDGSLGFSVGEIEKMKTSDAALLFQYLVTEGKVEFEKAFEVLNQLSTSKIGRILYYIYPDEILGKYFTKIGESDLNKAVNIILNIKESPHGSSTSGEDVGLNASSIFQKVDNKSLIEKILEKVSAIDPDYAEDIKNTKERIKAKYSGGADKVKIKTDLNKDIPTPETTRIRDTHSDVEKAIEVFQGEYAVSKPSHNRYLQSSGAGPCVIITLYDKKNKIGLLAHLDAAVDIYNSMDLILQKLKEKGADASNLEARIIGGQRSQSEKIVYEIKDRLNESNIKIVETDVLADPQTSKDILFDLETGEVYDYNETITTTPKDEFDKKAQRVINTDKSYVLLKHPDSLPE